MTNPPCSFWATLRTPSSENLVRAQSNCAFCARQKFFLATQSSLLGMRLNFSHHPIEFWQSQLSFLGTPASFYDHPIEFFWSAALFSGTPNRVFPVPIEFPDHPTGFFTRNSRFPGDRAFHERNCNSIGLDPIELQIPKWNARLL